MAGFALGRVNESTCLHKQLATCHVYLHNLCIHVFGDVKATKGSFTWPVSIQCVLSVVTLESEWFRIMPGSWRHAVTKAAGCPLIQVVKREYKDWKQILSTPLYFEAESNVLSIDIPAEGVVINEAWKIFPSSTPLMVGYYNFSDPPPYKHNNVMFSTL